MCIYIYIYVYIYIYITIRVLCIYIIEMGGAPRNPAPRKRFLAWIVKPSDCHCTDGHLTSRVFSEGRQTS